MRGAAGGRPGAGLALAVYAPWAADDVRQGCEEKGQLLVLLVLAVLALLNERGANQPTAAPAPVQAGDWSRVGRRSDRSDGHSRGTAFATLTRAAAAATPGNVVLVLPGTYDGTVTTKGSGRVGERISFRSEEPLGAEIVQGQYTAWENRGSYVDSLVSTFPARTSSAS